MLRETELVLFHSGKRKSSANFRGFEHKKVKKVAISFSKGRERETFNITAKGIGLVNKTKEYTEST